MLLFIGILYALCKQIYCVSIHLMLLFIERLISLAVAGFLFQYISCYSLSAAEINVSEDKERFNTSHVTLYLVLDEYHQHKTTFQYISCYSLSLNDYDKSSYSNSFQYISCYSLSSTMMQTT